MKSEDTELTESFETVARWCEEYFKTHRGIDVGHSVVTLVRLFGELATLSDDDAVKRSALNELAEAYIQRMARGDLSGIAQSALPPPSKVVQVEYRAHLALSGDTDWCLQPDECGTAGEDRRLEGFVLRLRGDTEQVGLRYRAHLALSSDTKWCRTNQYCGTMGQHRRVEAIWVELTDGADRYDVYYSAYLARFGWTGWFKNGQMCGTRGEHRQVEAIRLFLAEKPKGEKSNGRQR